MSARDYHLHDGKKALIKTRLAKRVRKGKFKSYSDYLNYVLNDETGKEFSYLIDTLSTNLTQFFREQKHFDFLDKEYLPAVLKKKIVHHDNKIRAWSAGCSTGEEPYSIAITVLESIKEFGDWNVKILATDISTHVLEIATQGTYDENRMKNISTHLKSSYFDRKRVRGEDIYKVKQSLQNAVIFRYLNLMQDWPIRGPLDFIFCRNVMIYFDRTTQTRLVNRFWDLLAPGGLLFTGHSESLTGIEHKFKFVQPTIYIKE